MTSHQTKFHPYWFEHMDLSVPKAPEVEPQCDVAVIGAGYAGLSVAITLAEAGKSVQVFDKEVPGRAASSRSGGITSGNIYPSLSALQSRFGAQRGLAMYAEGVRARDDLAQFIETEKISCMNRLSGRFTGATTPRNYETLARSADLLKRELGIEAHPVPRAEQHREIGSDHYHGGLLRPDIGGLHPGLFHQEMLRVAIQRGARVIPQTEARAIRRDEHGFTIDTLYGRTHCRDVVVCTNGYTDHHLPWLRKRLVPAASQIIATAPLPDGLIDEISPKRRMFGETRRVFHYFRSSPDDTRVLFGGRALGPFAPDAPLPFDHLRNYMVKVFPQLATVPVTHSWWGFVAFTEDNLPQLACVDGIHYATGFNGSGVVWARWFGKKAAERILLGRDANVSAFQDRNFKALPFNIGTPPWFLGPVVTWKRMLDRLGL